MPKLFLILIVAVGLSGCASTTGGPDAAQNDAATDAEVSQKPQERCYRENETGTRLGKRICVTVVD